MNIYVLKEKYDILGVFSTRELAEREKIALLTEAHLRHDRKIIIIEAEIDETRTHIPKDWVIGPVYDVSISWGKERITRREPQELYRHPTEAKIDIPCDYDPPYYFVVSSPISYEHAIDVGMKTVFRKIEHKSFVEWRPE